MVRHVVMWRVEEKEGLSKETILETLKRELEGLNGQIEGMTHIEVGLNYNEGASFYDAVLISDFVDREALTFYQKHEKHQHVANNFVRPFTVARAAVDYEY